LVESAKLRYTLANQERITMTKVQKTYTREFKEEAVRLVQTSGKPITQVARELGISDSSIHQWRKELGQHGKEAFLAVGIKPRSRRKIADSNESWKGCNRSAIS
jgi:transposase